MSSWKPIDSISSHSSRTAQLDAGRAAACRGAGDRARGRACRRRSGRRRAAARPAGPSARRRRSGPRVICAVGADPGQLGGDLQRQLARRQAARSPARTCRSGSTMLLANGMPKAAVFPEPVRDWTIRSRPAVMSGKVAACTGIGSVNPISSSARRTSACRPSSAKRDRGGVAGSPAAAPSSGRAGRGRGLESGMRSRRCSRHGLACLLNRASRPRSIRSGVRRQWRGSRGCDPAAVPGLTEADELFVVAGLRFTELAVDHGKLFPFFAERPGARAARSGSAARRPATGRARRRGPRTSAGLRRRRSARPGGRSSRGASPGRLCDVGQLFMRSSRCRRADGVPTGAPSGTACRRR